MKLYLLEQHDNDYHDTFDSIVVCAENSQDAVTIDPNGLVYKEKEHSFWAFKKESITCTEIGEANNKQERGVIIASFCAG
jgi:hypothetical protein